MWGVLILLSILLAFLLAGHDRAWWSAWAVPIALAIIYAVAYVSERSETSGDPQEELIAVVGLTAVAMTTTAVLLGRWAGRRKRRNNSAASRTDDRPE